VTCLCPHPNSPKEEGGNWVNSNTNRTYRIFRPNVFDYGLGLFVGYVLQRSPEDLALTDKLAQEVLEEL